MLFRGTDQTDSGVSLNTWAAYSGSTRCPDFTSTWYTTNDATFEITGVQLEVGDTATEFEHRPYGYELTLCERYYEIICDASTGQAQHVLGVGDIYSSTDWGVTGNFRTRKRTGSVSIEQTSNANQWITYSNGGTFNAGGPADDWVTGDMNWGLRFDSSSNLSGSPTAGHSHRFRAAATTAKIAFSAEL